ncbi:ribosome-associated translation inhibitor RaiA [Oleiagrimonas sp. C23AA]|uniref:ribosome hibernation-promoting factor, HPF/YfiA family n=1 Tax=Oleiagrimonas sp. C23AA TaxID=2719047 RepID=UPI001421ECFF|nr:ribosome-associated translation inhibitor RaiA [Oleiagrimonas sp. C23AA]NII11519.1 ribosome-associated translation inhibitor RaiA [Oleiagrimonas sp. C23AA]
MQLQVSGHQIDVTPALRDHVQSKLDRLTRHFDNITSLTVVLSVDKLKHCAEGTMAVAGSTLHAEAAGADMYASIDAMIAKLDAQLRKHKEKITDHHRSEAREARLG